MGSCKINRETEKIKKRYNRIAFAYNLMEAFMDGKQMIEWRSVLWKQARGKVLEVGVGTGSNVRYYPDDVEVVAIDFSENMLRKARQKADLLHRKVDLKLMDVENLRFSDASFDTVVTTCVFCSVPDPVKGLQEIKRVLKKDGQLFMLEHVRSKRRGLGLIMDLFNPLTLHLWGANINRNTVENLEKAGFRVDAEHDLMLDIVKHLKCVN